MMDKKVQYGVIPYTNEKKGVKVYLVTSKTNGYWIFPKGNPVKNKTSVQSAEQEAFEEGGLIGQIDKKKRYSASYIQNNTHHTLTLFPMEVEEPLDTWPEMDERRRKQVSVSKALELLHFEALQQCLVQWQVEKGD